MRICFVVNNARTQSATYTTLHLAFEAYRRGHDVRSCGSTRFRKASADIVSVLVRRKSRPLRGAAAYVKALTAADASLEEARLVDFDVIFLRNDPSRRRPGGGRVQPGARLRPPPEAAGVLVVNDPDGLSAPARRCTWPAFPEIAEDADHPFGRTHGASCARWTGRRSSSRWRGSAARTSSTWGAGRSRT